MATTSICAANAAALICDANAAALAGSPVQRLLLARDLGRGALAADQRMLQELCALTGSDARRHQRRQRWARRSPGRAAAVRWLWHRSEAAPAGRPGRLQQPGKTTAAGDDEIVQTAERLPEDLEVRRLGEARWLEALLLRDLEARRPGDLEAHRLGEAPRLAEARRPGETRWLGDLDSNQDCSVQSREFYR